MAAIPAAAPVGKIFIHQGLNYFGLQLSYMQIIRFLFFTTPNEAGYHGPVNFSEKIISHLISENISI
jgi:hypothetical protein